MPKSDTITVTLSEPACSFALSFGPLGHTSALTHIARTINTTRVNRSLGAPETRSVILSPDDAQALLTAFRARADRFRQEYQRDSAGVCDEAADAIQGSLKDAGISN